MPTVGFDVFFYKTALPKARIVEIKKKIFIQLD